MTSSVVFFGKVSGFFRPACVRIRLFGAHRYAFIPRGGATFQAFSGASAPTGQLRGCWGPRKHPNSRSTPLFIEQRCRSY